jgi:two-component sensor histidine kinase
VPLGLLATELLTISLKHGQGTVTLRLAHGGGRAVLSVGDAGPGFPEGFDPAASRGLGMRVALAMARQLRGTLRVEPGPGGRVVAEFPTA